MISLVLLGLAAGIVAADLWESMALAWTCLSIGLACFLMAQKKIAVFLAFFALGIICTITRLGMLNDPSPFFGQHQQYKVSSVKLVQESQGSAVWKAIIHEPEELAGSTVEVYSQNDKPGIYTLSGVLNPPVQYRNPGQGWHYKRKLYLGEIGRLYRPIVKEYRPVKQNILAALREKYRTNIINNLSTDAGSLALALTTGDRSLLDYELKSSVYMTGVGHIMALSGLHISVLTALILAILQRIGLGRIWALLVANGALLLFMIFVGPSPSLLRAVLMSVYGMIAAVTGRERLGRPALQWTAFAMLLYNPLWLFDYALVFSFLATYICITAGNRFDNYLAFMPGFLRRTASVTILIQFTALPLNIYLFGSFPLVGLLANLIIIPLLPLMAVLSMAAGLFSGAAGYVSSWPAEQLLTGVSTFLLALSQFSYPLEFGGIRLVTAGFLSSSLLMYLSGVPKKIIAAGLIICMLLIPAYRLWEHQSCSVWFMDVGQGDSILIRIKEKWILVDCGDTYAGSRAVVPAMKFLGVERLHALIITHPHGDHAGGMDAVLDNFPVERILVNADFPGCQWDAPNYSVEVVKFKENLIPELTILSHGLSMSNLNDTSLLVSLRVCHVGVLFTGDIEWQGESLYYPRVEPHQILKVAHHGSNSSTTNDFLHRVNPKTAVISCGLGNSFGFPGAETLGNLENAGVDIFRTDLSGCIHLKFWPWQGYRIVSFEGE